MPELLVEQLGKNGIMVKDPSLTIQPIASNNGKSHKTFHDNVLKQIKRSETKNGDND